MTVEPHHTSDDVTASDVLLANQLYYNVQAKDYDDKNHVASPSILKYYRSLFQQHVFASVAAGQLRQWRVCDVGCGTGFLESILRGSVGTIYAVDATLPMLQAAKRKFQGEPFCWLMGDARVLPLRRQHFDLVCSNAMLHHIYGYEEVLAQMVSLLKPGGKLFLGYEPNAIPYRLFWPLLKMAAKIVPEHRDRDRIRRESGQDQHRNLRDVDIHELAEFQIFHGHGIDPFQLRDSLTRIGVIDVRLHFSSIYQAALLKDSGIPFPVDYLPVWLYRMSGRLSLSFSLTGMIPA